MKNEIIFQKMYQYTTKISNYCVDYTYDRFIADTKLVEACVFNLIQLGELCRIAEDAFMQSYPQIPWREMKGLRNRIVHDYEGVNLRLVWEIICEDIPGLQSKIEKIFQDRQCSFDRTEPRFH